MESMKGKSAAKRRAELRGFLMAPRVRVNVQNENILP
jgi:hypothetical protein